MVGLLWIFLIQHGTLASCHELCISVCMFVVTVSIFKYLI